MKKREAPKNRNPIARVCARVNFAKVVPAKKGKGSYRREKRIDYVA